MRYPWLTVVVVVAVVVAPVAGSAPASEPGGPWFELFVSADECTDKYCACEAPPGALLETRWIAKNTGNYPYGKGKDSQLVKLEFPDELPRGFEVMEWRLYDKRVADSEYHGPASLVFVMGFYYRFDRHHWLRPGEQVAPKLVVQVPQRPGEYQVNVTLKAASGGERTVLPVRVSKDVHEVTCYERGG